MYGHCAPEYFLRVNVCGRVVCVVCNQNIQQSVIWIYIWIIIVYVRNLEIKHSENIWLKNDNDVVQQHNNLYE